MNQNNINNKLYKQFNNVMNSNNNYLNKVQNNNTHKVINYMILVNNLKLKLLYNLKKILEILKILKKILMNLIQYK